ncbi:hypothetical protein GCM10011403_11050 [Pseudohongiella nitratireducens]|jgi:hypothetical protein|uniref:NGG1p interacting factor NIF3 n=1 Tax=Pseudohongiella nitratireducens TaxID=1768907 RepID=A0A917LU81_9GAMM|nr:YqfO family protein [Pseudohongiella nitratireducens]MDF1621920.1 YqfO family protein [Pseudohongiella nitratireducens]GGG55711.1 hypothetical protein GCM10011403_11050 [Pseudohongiella nitratireducens]|tara:strand:+ start:1687 stop:1998 length:312 start_codon:yes stop_codon:yes gene_type:complete
MLKLTFFVPEDHAESVKQAVFDAGAGRIGDYEHCAWQCLGTGQFRPMQGANPFLGKVGDLETAPELRVEMVCEDHCIEAVIKALKSAHPFEEPAYDVIQVLDL